MMQKENISIFIQDTLHKNKILKLKDCKLWLSSLFKENSSITIRIVSEKESETLNYNYRNQKKPTNILSFVLSEDPLIGDIILCHPVIKNEAKNQNKKIHSHYAHLLIHGYLHLLGYSHDNKSDANRMERKEIHILKKYGFSNPY
ncbi:rRNA maturation RNase YbeY [Methylophilaceae bacterium]|nr:rRNA maturation RNase YbeY [Methylophilaceae bacterium]|tara:strand:+ start:58 stop:492 length:435 start_codon:yes stop_codon:yes gene_type:complete